MIQAFSVSDNRVGGNISGQGLNNSTVMVQKPSYVLGSGTISFEDVDLGDILFLKDRLPHNFITNIGGLTTTASQGGGNRLSRHLVLILEKTNYNFFGITISKRVGRKNKENGQMAHENLYDAYPSIQKLLVPVADSDVLIRSGPPLKRSFIMSFVRYVKDESGVLTKNVMKYGRKPVPEKKLKELDDRLNKLFEIANEIRH